MENEEWTSDTHKMFRLWSKQMKIREFAHIGASRKSKRYYYLFGYPTMFGMAIITSGTFAALGNSCEGGEDTILLMIGIFSAIITGLNATFFFGDFNTRCKDHQDAASDFGSLAREIDSELIQPPEIRENARTFITKVRTNYEFICKGAPTLSESHPGAFDLPNFSAAIATVQDDTDDKGKNPLERQDTTYRKAKNSMMKTLQYQWERLNSNLDVEDVKPPKVDPSESV